MIQKKPEWRELSFMDNFDYAAKELGYVNIPIAWGLAKVNWNSVEDRKTFVQALTNIKMGE